MDFEIRKDRKPQGRKKLTLERAAYFQLMQQGYSSREACRIVGIDVRTGKKWRNGRHAHKGREKAAPPIYQEAPPSSGLSRYLGEADRIHIADRLREKATVRAIAAELGRSPSTISREIRRNRHPVNGQYRPHAAHARLRPAGPAPSPGRSARTPNSGASSTLGTFLRSFTHGHALQLHAVHRRFLRELAAHTPLLPGCGEKAFIDVDSTHKRVYGRTKQGAEYGRFKGIRTLHPLLATICTPTSRPVIAAVRMRRGKAADSRGAPKLVRLPGCTARCTRCGRRASCGVPFGLLGGVGRGADLQAVESERIHSARSRHGVRARTCPSSSATAPSSRCWIAGSPPSEPARPVEDGQKPGKEGPERSGGSGWCGRS